MLRYTPLVSVSSGGAPQVLLVKVREPNFIVLGCPAGGVEAVLVGEGIVTWLGEGEKVGVDAVTWLGDGEKVGVGAVEVTGGMAVAGDGVGTDVVAGAGIDVQAANTARIIINNADSSFFMLIKLWQFSPEFHGKLQISVRLANHSYWRKIY